MAEVSTAPEGDAPEVSTATPLLAPREGVPPVVDTPEGLADVAAAIAAGDGPVAVDAERASGYRYGQRACLIQLRRAGSGTHLVDPLALDDLGPLAAALDGPEWVLHAASQDLPCLAEVGLRPRALFDTELAARLTGHPRVGLGPLVEEVLGFALEKGHSAADWSTRPLPEPWLRYAALDVELLVELRSALAAELDAQGKAAWADQEFAAVRDAPPAPPRVDPWRRTGGIHRLRTRRQLAVVRELWLARERRARARDLAPGRVLTDAAIISAAAASPATAEELLGLPGWTGRGARRGLDTWWPAVRRALELPEQELPPRSGPAAEGPPPPARWAERDPVAAARLAAVRAVVAATAERTATPVDNLVPPDALRRLAWEPPMPLSEQAVAAALVERRARRWQADLLAAPLAAALTAAPPPDTDDSD